MNSYNINLRVPFDEEGKPIAHPGGRSNIEWRDNIPFEATMCFDKSFTGYSGKRAALEDLSGIHYEMFLSDLLQMVRSNCNVEFGFVSGIWAFKKRGKYYGVCYLDSL